MEARRLLEVGDRVVGGTVGVGEEGVGVQAAKKRLINAKKKTVFALCLGRLTIIPLQISHRRNLSAVKKGQDIREFLHRLVNLFLKFVSLVFKSNYLPWRQRLA